jgi:hypothetical protein
MRPRTQLSVRQALLLKRRKPNRRQNWFSVPFAGDGAGRMCDGTSCASDAETGCQPGVDRAAAPSRGRQVRSGGYFDGLR